jgi:hypothetical protein
MQSLVIRVKQNIPDLEGKKSGRDQTRPAIEMRKKRFEKSTEETYS